MTEQELSDALAGYYDKGDMDTLLSGKADAVDIPDVSSFIDADVDNLANYFDKDGVHPLNRGYLEGYIPLIRSSIATGTVKS